MYISCYVETYCHVSQNWNEFCSYLSVFYWNTIPQKSHYLKRAHSEDRGQSSNGNTTHSEDRGQSSNGNTTHSELR